MSPWLLNESRITAKLKSELISATDELTTQIRLSDWMFLAEMHHGSRSRLQL